MKHLSFLLSSILFFSSCVNNSSQNKVKENNLIYDKAYSYLDSSKVDSAFLYFNKAKDIFLQQKDSLGIGKCLVNMAIILEGKGDYFGSQDISLNALSFFDQKKKDQFSFIKANFNSLGIATYKLKEYKDALKFYDLAIKFSRDSAHTLIYLNNKAKTYEELKKYKEALKIYDHVIKGTNQNQIEYARTLTNISYAKWLQNSTYNALPGLLSSLSIRQKENDLLGQNHSYARLTDYYTKIKPSTALIYANKMYQVAEQLNSPDDRLEALEKLVKLSSGIQSKQYFERYRNLEDSVQKVRNESKNQFALIRYETEKHKADNLVLQKDNTEKKYQVISLIIGILVVALVSIILYKKRKQRIELASQNAIRENQLKTSKKVHDVVANGLYRVMTEIENTENLDRDEVLDKLEDMYEKSRDLSYEEIHYSDQNFHEKITTLLKSFATETTKIVFMGNTEELWKKVDRQIKYEIEHILQELMVNMKKHSGASNVAIRFEQQEDRIAIYYADNGVGMASEQQFKNGLTNTGNRIININGEITFETKMEKGLKIQISFPVLNR